LYTNLIGIRGWAEYKKAWIMPENVRRLNLERSIKAQLSHYEFENHVTCINVEDLFVDRCLGCNGVVLSDDCLEDCCQGHFEGRCRIHMPMADNEDGGFIENQADFSGTFDVVGYNRDSQAIYYYCIG